MLRPIFHFIWLHMCQKSLIKDLNSAIRHTGPEQMSAVTDSVSEERWPDHTITNEIWIHWNLLHIVCFCLCSAWYCPFMMQIVDFLNGLPQTAICRLPVSSSGRMWTSETNLICQLWISIGYFDFIILFCLSSWSKKFNPLFLLCLLTVCYVHDVFL